MRIYIYLAVLRKIFYSYLLLWPARYLLHAPLLLYTKNMQITWDLIVLLALALGTLYGAFMGRNKILGILVYLYLGLAVAQVSGGVVFDWVGNLSIVSSRFVTTEFGVKTLIFLGVTALLMFKSEISGLDSAGSLSKIQTGVLGFLVATLSLASIFGFMSSAEVASLNSNFALIIYSWRAAIVVVPVLAMVVLAFLN
jgi:hypothetical protein